MKKSVTVKLTPGVDLLLIKLAAKNDRSQGKQIEFMIKNECQKQGVK